MTTKRARKFGDKRDRFREQDERDTIDPWNHGTSLY